MISITCAEDVKKAFPRAKVGSNGIFSDGGSTYLDWDDQLQEMRIDGILTAVQFIAVSYWLTHRHEFTESVSP